METTIWGVGSKLLKGGDMRGVLCGSIIHLIKWDTRNLDHSSYGDL